MADVKEPQGLEEFLAEEIGKLGEMAGSNLDQFGVTLRAAMKGDPEAQKDLAEHTAGLATMGALKSASPSIKIIDDIKQPLGKVANDIKQAGKEVYGKVIHDYGTPQPKPDYGKVIVKPFADGGEVPSGLEEFISGAKSPPAVDNLGETSTPAPNGLEDFIAPELKQEKYGAPLEQVKAGLEGAAQGLIGPLAPLAETSLGVNPEDIRARAEANPVTHYASEAAGLIGPALLTGGASLLTKGTQAGLLSAIGSKIALGSGETLASKIGTAAARGAIENMLLSGSDEVSKMILKDPEQSAQTAITTIGLAGLLGAGVGAGATGASHLWDAAVGSKASKFITDFKGRIADHIENPEPVVAVKNELEDLYKSTRDVIENQYGSRGLSKEDLMVARPELSPEQIKESHKLYTKVGKAFEEYEPYLKDFEKKFTTKLTEGNQVDPGKVATYLKQLGKPNAEIKQQVLQDYIKAAEKYKRVLHEAHVDLNLESPVEHTPLNNVMNTFEEQTLGSKIADALIHKSLTGAGLGAATGAALGSLVGHGELGAIVGKYSLEPFFNSVLPAIAKSLSSNKVSSKAFRDTVDYGISVAQGEAMINRATKNIFKAGSEVLPSSWHPSDADKARLDKKLANLQTNPMPLFSESNKTNHYLPEHGMALDQTASSAVVYLNSLRPDRSRKAPLDTPPVPSASQKAAYDNALSIAQQPLLVLDKIKKGTVTQQDITTLGTLYPSLYNKLKQRLVDGMINHTSKNEPIAYKTRVALSMFLAEPLDSTMAPTSIMSAQLQGPVSPESQSGRQPADANKGVKSSPALQKMPSMYSTPSQTRIQHRQK